MPNIAIVLKEEVQRLAKKEVKAGFAPLRRDNIRLKKAVAELRRELAALDRTTRKLQKKAAAIEPPAQSGAERENGMKLRPTASSLLKIRQRLGLTQVQFAKLLGVSPQSVVNWASKEGRVRMREPTLAALAGIQKIGKREVWRRLESTDQPRTKHR